MWRGAGNWGECACGGRGFGWAGCNYGCVGELERKSERAPGAEFSILGMPVDGTFSQFIDVPVQNLRLLPEHLSVEQGAAIPLAGCTAFRALFTKGAVKKGDRVLVTGIGGGVAMFALQFAIAAGATVYVSSSDESKIAFAVSLGAAGGVNYKCSDWVKQLKNMLKPDLIDCVIDGAGGESIAQYLKVVKNGGRIVSYGATGGSASTITLPFLFLNNVDLLGTAMGSPEDFDAMVEFVRNHRIVPIVDSVWPLDDLPKALDKMRSSQQTGKIVLQHSKL